MLHDTILLDFRGNTGENGYTFLAFENTRGGKSRMMDERIESDNTKNKGVSLLLIEKITPM